MMHKIFIYRCKQYIGNKGRLLVGRNITKFSDTVELGNNVVRPAKIGMDVSIVLNITTDRYKWLDDSHGGLPF